MNRTITVVSTTTQSNYVINSSAATLGELKQEMTNAGINYEGMAFHEGIANIELKDDSSILPHDTPYHGGVTNDLLIILTAAEKNIKSGVDLDVMQSNIDKLLYMIENLEGKIDVLESYFRDNYDMLGQLHSPAQEEKINYVTKTALESPFGEETIQKAVLQAQQ